jgi:hypothetical protein
LKFWIVDQVLPASPLFMTNAECDVAISSLDASLIAQHAVHLITLTPDHMADWSSGAVTIGFSVSTFQTDPRDWITIDVTPFAEQLALPFNEGEVDLQGMPAHYVELKTDVFNGRTQWKAVEGPSKFCGSFCGLDAGQEWPPFVEQTGITPSKTVRTPFQFTFNRTSYSFRVAPNAPAQLVRRLVCVCGIHYRTPVWCPKRSAGRDYWGKRL